MDKKKSLVRSIPREDLHMNKLKKAQFKLQMGRERKRNKNLVRREGYGYNKQRVDKNIKSTRKRVTQWPPKSGKFYGNPLHLHKEYLKNMEKSLSKL